MFNRLTKSAEQQARVDEEYFSINMEGHQLRLKCESTLKNCYQVGESCDLAAGSLIKSGFLVAEQDLLPQGHRILKQWDKCNISLFFYSEGEQELIGLDAHCFLPFFVFQIVQELEKQRLEVLCNILSRYNLHMSSFGQALNHVRTSAFHPPYRGHSDVPKQGQSCGHFCSFQGQKQIEQAVQRVDMEEDIQTLVDENSAAAEENTVEFLMTDYFVSLFSFSGSENLL